MPNSKYVKGVALEREVVNVFKKAGCEAWRSAGSHGPYDVQVIMKHKTSPHPLVAAGFVYDLIGHKYERVGTKYIDTLYPKTYIGLMDYALFFQCKRKEK